MFHSNRMHYWQFVNKTSQPTAIRHFIFFLKFVLYSVKFAVKLLSHSLSEVASRQRQIS